MDQKRDPKRGDGSKWWWLPGTLAAFASAARFVYQILRDHRIL